MMQEVPINVVGPTGGHRSRQFSDELTLNMYLDYNESSDRKGCHDFPGLKTWCTASGADRGWHIMNTILYKVNGSNLVSVSSAGTATTLGTIGGSDRAIFADDGTNLYIVAGGSISRWNGSSLSAVTQSVVANPGSIAYINRQFIITGDNGLFGTSDVGDGTTYNALNYAEAEASPDPLFRAYVYSQLLYLAGSKSVEPWWNSGEGNPPFARQDSALMNIGIAGKYAITSTDQYMYWLNDERQFVQSVGSSARAISTPSISHKVEAYSIVSDCIASTCTFDGQVFVFFAFPAANKTLFYSETSNYWGELQSDTEYPGDRWYGNAVIRCYDKNLVADYRNGNVYELDLSTYTDNGDTRLRIRTLPTITSRLIGRPGRRVTVSGITFDCQVGVGLATGQGVNPVLMCEFANDGGHTYGAESQVSIGAMGDYTLPVKFDAFATGYAIRTRIKCSDPVYFSLFDAAVVKMRDAGY